MRIKESMERELVRERERVKGREYEREREGDSLRP